MKPWKESNCPGKHTKQEEKKLKGWTEGGNQQRKQMNSTLRYLVTFWYNPQGQPQV